MGSWDFNQEMLNPETDLKALETSAKSVLLHVDWAATTRERTSIDLATTSISSLQASSFGCSFSHFHAHTKVEEEEVNNLYGIGCRILLDFYLLWFRERQTKDSEVGEVAKVNGSGYTIKRRGNS